MTSTKRKVRKPVIAARRAKSKRSPGLLRALQIASCGPSDAVMAIPMEMLGMLNISEQRLVDAAVRKRFNSPDFQLMWA